MSVALWTRPSLMVAAGPRWLSNAANSPYNKRYLTMPVMNSGSSFSVIVKAMMEIVFFFNLWTNLN